LHFSEGEGGCQRRAETLTNITSQVSRNLSLIPCQSVIQKSVWTQNRARWKRVAMTSSFRSFTLLKRYNMKLWETKDRWRSYLSRGRWQSCPAVCPDLSFITPSMAGMNYRDRCRFAASTLKLSMLTAELPLMILQGGKVCLHLPTSISINSLPI
jgi:hypothetical protein